MTTIDISLKDRRRAADNRGDLLFDRTTRTGTTMGSTTDGALALALSHHPSQRPAAAPLAEVIELASRRPAAARPSPWVYRRRRAGVVAAFAAFVLALTLLVGGAFAEADLERPATAGAVVLAPGDTLWGIAAEHAPEGVPTAEYVERIRAVNDFGNGSLEAWTVVLLPADAAAAPAGVTD